MSASKPRKINGLFVLVATIGILFGSAGPAAATVTGGAANGVGYELGPNFAKLCSDTNNTFTGAYFSTTYYLITHQSATFLVYDGAVPVAYYSGPLSVNAQHEGAILGPQGGKPAVIGDCTNGQVFSPAQVPLTRATLMGAANGGSVNCAVNGNGSYLRVTDDVTITFTGSCTVVGNTSGLTATRTHTATQTWTGKQTICQSVPSPGCTHADAGSQLTGTLSIS